MSNTTDRKLAPAIGTLIQVQLKLAGKKQRDIALEANISESAVSQMLGGTKAVSDEVLIVLHALLPDWAKTNLPLPPGKEVYRSGEICQQASPNGVADGEKG